MNERDMFTPMKPSERPEENRRYIDELTQDVKVVVLGDAEAGKSHLISRIVNPDQSIYDYVGWKGSGINIHKMNYVINNRLVTANFVDFGGMEIRYSLHRFFMTRRALYMIVLNVRDDSQDDQAMRWLNEIDRYAPGSPALLVLNKIDQNPNAALNQTMLMSRYPNLRGVVRVSAFLDDPEEFRAKMIEPLDEAIVDFVERMLPVMPVWQEIRSILEKRYGSCINVDDIKWLWRSHGLDTAQSDFEHFLDWFINICGCYYFDSNYHYLVRADRISEAYVTLLNTQFKSNQCGMVSHEEILRILEERLQDWSSLDEIEIILNAIRNFKLSFRVNETTECLPMLCNRDASPLAEKYRYEENTLEFRVQFEDLPIYVIHCLMAERFAELDLSNTWYSGARFASIREVSAVVESSKDTIIIYVLGEHPHRAVQYMDDIRTHLEKISESLRLRITDRSIVYEQGGLHDLFSYDVLLGSMNSGQTHVYSRVFERLIPIREILKQPDETAQKAEEALVHNIAEACNKISDTLRRERLTEDSLNGILRDYLWEKGYLIADQRLLTLPGRSGKNSGEVDILLMDENRAPWTMLEGLRVTGSGRSSLEQWGDHLSLLLHQFTSTQMGLSTVFLVSYVECDKENYIQLWNKFAEHMRWYDPDRGARKADSFSEVFLAGNANPYLRIGECSYELRGRTVTVYHYFVRIPPKIANKADPSGTIPRPPESVPAEVQISGETEPDPVSQPEEKLPASEPPDTQTAVNEEIALYEYRVVFLGDSEAGKSQILARVMDPEKGLTEFDGKTTQGICLEHKYYDMKGHHVRINYWDFGGQEVLHSLHRMFLSGRTLYVIVLNTRNDNYDAQADFWMRYVETYASGAPVLFVLNKIDQNPKAKLNLSMLNRRFKKQYTNEDVLRICAIDEDHNKFRQEFTEKLVDRVTAAVDFTDGYNSRTLKIRTEVEKLKEQGCIIKTDDFRGICEEAGLNEEDAQNSLMERFHQAGILVFFGTDFKMLLDPQWITKAIYKVLEKEGEISVNGIVVQKKLETLCRKELGGSENAEFILKIMRFKHLSYIYKERITEDPVSENQEFIPMLCRSVEPPEINDLTQTDNTMEMRMYFEYLPPSLLYRLMVAFRGNLDTEFVWRSGARFKFGELVYVIVRQDGNMMSIYAHHETEGTKEKALGHMKELMALIRTEAKTTANLLEVKLGYMVGTIMEYFDYDRLLNAQKCDICYVASKVRGGEKIVIDDILTQKDSEEQRLVQNMLDICRKGCEKLQGRQMYWFPKKKSAADSSVPKMDEDNRTLVFKDELEHSFCVAEQPRWGESATGIKPGELDLKIDTLAGKSLAILEALIITGDNKASRESWIEHLERMMRHYNKNGFRHLMLVSYLDCGLKNRNNVQKAYLKLLRTHYVPEYGTPTVNPDVMPGCPNGLQVVQADYSSGAGKVSVYHFLVHIPRYNPQESTAGNASGENTANHEQTAAT